MSGVNQPAIITFTTFSDPRRPEGSTNFTLLNRGMMLVEIDSDEYTRGEIVAIPLCKKMPTYIKYRRGFYKLTQTTSGHFFYPRLHRSPHANAKVALAQEPQGLRSDPECHKQRGKALNAITFLVQYHLQ